MKEVKRRCVVCHGLFLHDDEQLCLNVWQREANKRHSSMCTVTCWEHLQNNRFSHKDTNSKYLSFKSLGVDGFPCTLQ